MSKNKVNISSTLLNNWINILNNFLFNSNNIRNYGIFLKIINIIHKKRLHQIRIKSNYHKIRLFQGLSCFQKTFIYNIFLFCLLYRLLININPINSLNAHFLKTLCKSRTNYSESNYCYCQIFYFF